MWLEFTKSYRIFQTMKEEEILEEIYGLYSNYTRCLLSV